MSWRVACAALAGVIPGIGPLSAQTAPAALAPVVVTATRAERPVDESPFAIEVFGAGRLRASPATTIDDVLRESPAFSLFRRSGSLSANPTAQGVSLRGIGPSGASRSLLLLDGVPLNDPFGGWVAWSKVSRESLAGAEIVRGGGSGAWGNAALGGVIQLFTAAPEETGASASMMAAVGGFGTWTADVASSIRSGDQAVRIAAAAFATDGFHPLASIDRGPIDTPLASRHEMLQATWETAVSHTTRLALTARWFEEERENGTSLQRNASREGFGSVTLKGEPAPAFRWSASLHFQNQNFDSFFSAVNAARTAETPANHQFDVPARTIGMATVGTWSAGGNITTAGIDARHIEGDTNETFLFDGSQFTRLRSAGGTQQFVGAFVNHDRALGTESLCAVAGLRIDHWRNLDGFRREKALANHATLRDDRQPEQSEFEISPHFGAVWKINGQWRTRASVYRAFRVPTLNEYHRPFRVGIIATEANPSLREESLTGAEIGADFTTRRFRASFTVFGNRFEDAVANVTLSRTPTAINRQRQNLDRLDIVGIEANAEWNPTRSLRIAVDLLQSDATVERARAQPALEGRRLAQVPRQCVTASVDWTAAERVVISVRARRGSEQFEDDENLLPLAAATTVDAQVRWQFREDLQFFAALENAFDENVQTGRSNEDIISLGPPRNLRAGFRATW